MQQLTSKSDAGDVRSGSQGDVYPFVIVGTEVYDDNGNLVRPLGFHVQCPAGGRVSRRYDNAAAAEEMAREAKTLYGM